MIECACGFGVQRSDYCPKCGTCLKVDSSGIKTEDRLAYVQDQLMKMLLKA